MEGGEVRKAGRGRKKKETVRQEERSENVNDSHIGGKKMMNGKLGNEGKGVGRKRKGGLEILPDV